MKPRAVLFEENKIRCAAFVLLQYQVEVSMDSLGLLLELPSTCPRTSSLFREILMAEGKRDAGTVVMEMR